MLSMMSTVVAARHLAERFEHRVEHTGLDPSSVAGENAVTLARRIGQLTLLRARPRHPHHTVERAPVVLRAPTPVTTLGRQQRTDQRPLVILKSNPLAQRCLQKTASNQAATPPSSFVHEA